MKSIIFITTLLVMNLNVAAGGSGEAGTFPSANRAFDFSLIENNSIDFKVGQFKFLSHSNNWLLKTHKRVIQLNNYTEIEKYLKIVDRIESAGMSEFEVGKVSNMKPFEVDDFKNYFETLHDDLSNFED